jgi:hypothetical protein
MPPCEVELDVFAVRLAPEPVPVAVAGPEPPALLVVEVAEVTSAELAPPSPSNVAECGGAEQ